MSDSTHIWDNTFLAISIFTVSIVVTHTADCILLILCHNIYFFTSSQILKLCVYFQVYRLTDMWPLYLASFSLPCLSIIPSCLLSHPHIFSEKCPYMSTKQWEERQSHWVNCPSFTADGCWQYVNGSICFVCSCLLRHKYVCVYYMVRRRFGLRFYFSWLIVKAYELITAAITGCIFSWLPLCLNI